MLGAFVLTACKTTFDPALLQPGEQQVSPKLPALKIKNGEHKISLASLGSLPGNSKMFTLFQRELPNICEQNGNYKGTIESVVTINESNMTNKALFIFSTLTLYTINLLGLPMFSADYQLEVEFNLYNLNGAKIWTKPYYKDTRVLYGVYYGLGKREDEIVLKMYREMLKELKMDLQTDYKAIGNNLNL